jgi:HYR domain
MKKLNTIRRVASFSLALMIAPAWLGGIAVSHAQTLVYNEDFQTDHSADETWVVNSVGGFNPVNLHFDYSTVGIPPAPHSVGGTTHGLKLQANLSALLQQFPSGSSASPVAFSIPEHFEMHWDWWINYNGPLATGGQGSTQIGGAGFGTAGTVAQVPLRIDSIYVCASGESLGTAADFRVYSPRFQGSLQDASGVYAAPNPGARNHSNPYYQATFPPVAAPPAQLALFPQQSGLTPRGSAGMAWHDALVRKTGNVTTYWINGLLIATIDASTNGVLGGSRIVFGHFDSNTNASNDPNALFLAFSLVDNIRVTDLCLGDTELPVITPLADILATASSPAGAVVDYDEPMASDNCPNPVTVVCEPASGSMFPIGDTTVICTAQDAAGNTALSAFSVHVKGAAEQIVDLIALVQSLGLRPASENSLGVKLKDASAHLSRNQFQGACGKLKDFIAEVTALANNGQLTPWDAYLLIQEANRIRAVIGCVPTAL